MLSGARSSGPAIVDSSIATSRTVRPIGPTTEGVLRKPSLGTRPKLGRSETRLAQAAGLRSDPMKSLPSATGSIRKASADPAPPLLPPALRVVS